MTTNQDLRYAARTLRKSPGYTTAALLTLALGIGANTAIFSAVNSLLLKSSPYQDPARIVFLWSTWPEKHYARMPVFIPEFLELQRDNRVFAQMAGFENISANLTGGGMPERLEGARVSASFFPVLGMPPLLGRTFLESEDQAGDDRVVILSSGLWRRRFAADPNITSKTIHLNGAAYTVVGVMPPHFRFSAGVTRMGLEFPNVEFWKPLALTRDERTSYSGADLSVIARLKEGTTLAQAQAEMEPMHRTHLERHGSNLGTGILVAPIEKELSGDLRRPLWLLLGAAGCVLLVACANLTNLVLARGAARQKEITVRLAIGAGRTAIVRQLMTESLVLALSGGALGLGLAVWIKNLLVALSPVDLERRGAIALDWRVLAFTLALSIATGIFFGLVPAWKLSRPDLQEALKESGRGTSGSRRQGLRGVLVVLETGVAAALVIGAGLLIVSFARIMSVNPGFDREHVLTMDLPLSDSKYPDLRRRAAFFDRLLDRMRAVPGVQAAAVVNALPLQESGQVFFTIEGRAAPKPEESPLAVRHVASPDHLRVMRIPLLEGRWLTDRDRDGATPVAVIDEQMARTYWPNQDPIGKRFKIGTYGSTWPWITIAGVTANVRQYGLDEAPRPGLYLPYQQAARDKMALEVRTAANPAALIGATREAIRSVDADQPIVNVRTMEQIVERSVAARSFQMWLLASFASLAFVLAAIGLYGVMSYNVVQRTQEIGVRMALGARKRDVLMLIVTRGMSLVAAGLALGIAGALGFGQLLRSQLYGVSGSDPVTFIGVPVILAAVGLLACWLPARRAARIDPITAIRYE